jgi:hypothetical protein
MGRMILKWLLERHRMRDLEWIEVAEDRKECCIASSSITALSS